MSDERFTIKPTSLRQCDWCGATNIFWCYSRRTGKRYPVEVMRDDVTGELWSTTSSWHSKSCPGKTGIPNSAKTPDATTPVQAPKPQPQTPPAAPKVPVAAGPAPYLPTPQASTILPSLSAEMLEGEHAHELVEGVIAIHKQDLAAVLEAMYSMPSAHGVTPKAVDSPAVDLTPRPHPDSLDRDELHAKMDVIRNTPEPPKTITPPAPKALVKRQVSALKPTGALGSYMCNNSKCSVVRVTEQVKIGKTHTCPTCDRPMLFMGLEDAE